MTQCKHDWHFVQGLTERLRCLRCGVMTWPKSVEERTQEMLADVLTVGSAWSKDGERIDPASVFKDHGAIHSCSYHCDRPECIKAQRDELRERLAQPNDFNPDWDAMAVMVEEQQRMATEIDNLKRRLKSVNTAAMRLTSDLTCMEVDDDERLDRDRVMGRVMQWRNEWDKAMFKEKTHD